MICNIGINSRRICRCRSRIGIVTLPVNSNLCRRSHDLQASVVSIDFALDSKFLADLIVSAILVIVQDRATVVGQDEAASRKCRYGSRHGIGVTLVHIGDRGNLIGCIVQRIECHGLTVNGFGSGNGVCPELVPGICHQIVNLHLERFGDLVGSLLGVVGSTVETVFDTYLGRSLRTALVASAQNSLAGSYLGSFTGRHGQFVRSVGSTELHVVQTIRIALTRIAECHGKRLFLTVLGRQVNLMRDPLVGLLVRVGDILHHLPGSRVNITVEVFRGDDFEFRAIRSLLVIPRQIECQFLAHGLGHVELGHHGIGHNLAQRRVVRSALYVVIHTVVDLAVPTHIAVACIVRVARYQRPFTAFVVHIVDNIRKVVGEIGHRLRLVLLGRERLHVTAVLLAVSLDVCEIFVCCTGFERVERDAERRSQSHCLNIGIILGRSCLVCDTGLAQRAVEFVRTAQFCTVHRHLFGIFGIHGRDSLDLHALIGRRKRNVVDAILLRVGHLDEEPQSDNGISLGYGERCSGKFPALGGLAGQRQVVPCRTAVGRV